MFILNSIFKLNQTDDKRYDLYTYSVLVLHNVSYSKVADYLFQYPTNSYRIVTL